MIQFEIQIKTAWNGASKTAGSLVPFEMGAAVERKEKFDRKPTNRLVMMKFIPQVLSDMPNLMSCDSIRNSN